jgi:hypothetical protein
LIAERVTVISGHTPLNNRTWFGGAKCLLQTYLTLLPRAKSNPLRLLKRYAELWLKSAGEFSLGYGLQFTDALNRSFFSILLLLAQRSVASYPT